MRSKNSLKSIDKKFDNALPSQPLPGFWLSQDGPLSSSIRTVSSTTGKWMVFINSARADELWPLVKASLKSGSLSGVAISAKISLPDQTKPNRHVLIIYTADYRNKDTVKECLLAIRELGATGTLYYKTDIQTVSGVYAGGKARPWLYSSDMFESIR